MPLFSTMPAPLRRYILGQLHDALPPPPDDRPETLEARTQIALASVVRLTPMNIGEAQLAVQAIAAEAHASDALRSAGLNRGDLRVVGQCRAQSSSMIRQAMALRKELRIVQWERRAAEWQREREIAAEAEARERGMADHRRAAVDDRRVEPDAIDTGMTGPEAAMAAPVAPARDGALRQGWSHRAGQNPIQRSSETDVGRLGLKGMARASSRGVEPGRNGGSRHLAPGSRTAA